MTPVDAGVAGAPVPGAPVRGAPVLARAAVVRPQLLVADEPISHQNREWGTAIVGLIQDLAVEGTACLLATHDELAIAAADRVLDLRDGRLQPRDA